MTGLLFSFGMCFAAGAYLLLADLFHISTRANTKAILQAAKLGKTNTSGLEVLLFRLSAWLAERLPLTDYYRRKMEATLRSAGIRLTPEVFVAQAVIKAGLIFCAGIALLPLLPLLSPLLIFLAIALFFKDIRSADEAVRKKGTNRGGTAAFCRNHFPRTESFTGRLTHTGSLRQQCRGKLEP